ncbi:MAG TPA: PQQ-binding-like beta-propeller repeat protein [Bacteroidales bacterium]|nr:PQQ-binding-like beta-propeller repeat protein [Bacteroidales bacterium]
MKIPEFLFAATLVFYTISLSGQQKPERQWPEYRGLNSSGVLDNVNLPDSFNVSSGYNIKWKADVPGLGLSSPVIWGNRLFITTAVSKSDNSGFKPGIYGDVQSVNDTSLHEWKVLCYDKTTGKLLWDRTACEGVPAMKRHPKSTHANTSVATDGRYVIAFFGSEGLYCYDTEGRLLWKKSFGVLKSVFFMMPGAQWEFASSPVLSDGKLIILCDVLENSFLAAYDPATGREMWKTNRDDYPGWSTPNVYRNGGKSYVVVNGYKHMGGYDLQTGKEVWRMSGGGDIPIPTPVVGKDLVYLNSAHGMNSPVIAVNTSAAGDITLPKDSLSSNFVRWKRPRGASYMHTLLLYNDHLYNVGWNGSVVCLDPATGKEIFNGKLGKSKSFVASPVAADGKIYIADEEGTVYIIKDGTGFKLLKEIPLGEKCMTAPALTDGMIYFRTQKGLVAAGK